MRKKPVAAEARDRYQLVISLGEGLKGAALKAKLEAGAEANGMNVSAWSRLVLAEAVGAAESLSLGERVKRLELQMSRVLRALDRRPE